MNRQTYQETSYGAYLSIKPTLNNKETAIYELLSQHQDMTNQEIKQALGWEICSVTGRTNSLVKKEKIIEAGKRICRVKGNRVIAWKIRREVPIQTTVFSNG